MDYHFTTEVVRVTLVVGVVVSIMVYERLHVTTGGAIVPAYLALGVIQPLSVLMTILAGLATFVVVHRGLLRRRIIYGRRRFEIEVLVGLAIILVATLIAAVLDDLDPAFAGVAGIGFLVPGIIAHDMGRQGPKKTISAVTATAALLAVFAFLLQSLLDLVPGGKRPNVIELSSTIGYPREMLILAVAMSVLAGMVIFQRMGIRSGGFITGAYVALVSPRWGDLVFAAAVAVSTWWIVTRILMPRLLLFGRRKLSAMLLVGSSIAWSLELLVLWATHGTFQPWLGLTVATLMVPALVANDAQRQGWEATLWGVTISSAAVYAGANLCAAVALAGGLL